MLLTLVFNTRVTLRTHLKILLASFGGLKNISVAVNLPTSSLFGLIEMTFNEFRKLSTDVCKFLTNDLIAVTPFGLT